MWKWFEVADLSLAYESKQLYEIDPTRFIIKFATRQKQKICL